MVPDTRGTLSVIRGMTKSRRFLALFLGGLVVILVRLGDVVGIPIPPDIARELAAILGGLLMTYITGVSATGWGKETERLRQSGAAVRPAVPQ